MAKSDKELLNENQALKNIIKLLEQRETKFKHKPSNQSKARKSSLKRIPAKERKF